jgi:hypothetical protein
MLEHRQSNEEKGINKTSKAACYLFIGWGVWEKCGVGIGCISTCKSELDDYRLSLIDSYIVISNM